MQRGLDWLSGEQEADGSWFGRWGVNYIYGTGAAVPALVRAGVPPEDARIRRAVAWLEDHQNPDGGWGEDLRSYIDVDWHGRGASTASQTAWALLALLAAGETESAAVRRGVAWLVDTQRTDGTWDEPWFTGTGFPWDFNINYHLYRLVLPVMALGPLRARPGPSGGAMNDPMPHSARPTPRGGPGGDGRREHCPGGPDRRRAAASGGHRPVGATRPANRARSRWPVSPALWSTGWHPAPLSSPTGSWTSGASRCRRHSHPPRWWRPACDGEGWRPPSGPSPPLPLW